MVRVKNTEETEKKHLSGTRTSAYVRFVGRKLDGQGRAPARGISIPLMLGPASTPGLEFLFKGEILTLYFQLLKTQSSLFFFFFRFKIVDVCWQFLFSYSFLFILS